MKKILITALIIAFAACVSKKATTAVAPAATDFSADISRGAIKYPGYSAEEFHAGKTLYENNCGSCHSLKEPSSRNAPGWKQEVARMAPKANRKAGAQVVGEKEQDLIVKYLVTMGSAPKSGK